MQTTTFAPAPEVQHGFELVKQQYVAEYNSDVRLYKHQKTGLPCSSPRTDSVPAVLQPQESPLGVIVGVTQQVLTTILQLQVQR